MELAEATRRAASGGQFASRGRIKSVASDESSCGAHLSDVETWPDQPSTLAEKPFRAKIYFAPRPVTPVTSRAHVRYGLRSCWSAF